MATKYHNSIRWGALASLTLASIIASAPIAALLTLNDALSGAGVPL